MSTGFVDIQVNGYSGVDFQGAPLTPAQIKHVADRLAATGCRAILPTFITDEPDVLAGRVRAFDKLVDTDKAWRRAMPAYHIEGPCLSPEDGYRGAHNPALMVEATPEVFKPILDAAPGRIAMVTLAPERDPGMKTTRWLVEQGVVVSMGHTNAPRGTIVEAVAAGVTLFTHLGNGCANTIPRHDNVLNRALSVDGLTYSLIPDGHHVPWFVLKLWIRLAGIERLVFTSDCMAAADGPSGRYKIAHHEVEVGEDRMVRPPGMPYLAGSALTMREAFDNAVKHLGLSREDATRLTSTKPAAIISKHLT